MSEPLFLEARGGTIGEGCSTQCCAVIEAPAGFLPFLEAWREEAVRLQRLRGGYMFLLPSEPLPPFSFSSATVAISGIADPFGKEELVDLVFYHGGAELPAVGAFWERP